MGLQGTLCPVGIVRRFTLRTGVLRLDAYLMLAKEVMKKTTAICVLTVSAFTFYASGEGLSLPPPPDAATLDAYDSGIMQSLRDRVREEIRHTGQTATPEQETKAIEKYVAVYQEKNQRACALAEKENKPLRVSGTVTDGTGAPLSNAVIQFSVSVTRVAGKTFKMQQEIKVPFETKTDGHGLFAVTNLLCRSAQITNMVFQGRNMILSKEQRSVFLGTVSEPVALSVGEVK